MRTILYDPPEIEYLDGHPHPKVSPKTTHTFVQTAFVVILQRCGTARGFCGTEWRFDPGQVDRTPTEFVPDVAFVSKERFYAVPVEQRDKLPFSPDIAVEVRSPKDDLKYLREKIERYLATGSILAFDVDPKKRFIDAYAPSGVRRYTPGMRFEHEAAPWLQFDVDEVFADLDALEAPC
jgi:Uma2 family endonuclease